MTKPKHRCGSNPADSDGTGVPYAGRCALPVLEYVIEHGMLSMPKAHHSRDVVVRRFLLEPDLAERLIAFFGESLRRECRQGDDTESHAVEARALLAEMIGAKK